MFVTVGAYDDQAESASVCAIFGDIKLVFAFVMAIFSSAIWASIDPILEPELKNKVIFVLKMNVENSWK